MSNINPSFHLALKRLQYQLHHFRLFFVHSTSKTPLNRYEKGRPMYSTSCFYPLSRWLRYQFHPISNYFILRSKSLTRFALRAPPNPEVDFRPLPSQILSILILNYIYINLILFLSIYWKIYKHCMFKNILLKYIYFNLIIYVYWIFI